MTTQERNELIKTYADGYNEVIKALGNFPAESLTAHPIPDKWSACEIVQHLADSEMNSAIRIRKLLTEDNPIIQGYDENLYANKLNYNSRDITPALDAFKGARATTVQIITNLSDDQWKRTGTHTESGKYSAQDWLRIYASHAHNHAEQIKRLRLALS